MTENHPAAGPASGCPAFPELGSGTRLRVAAAGLFLAEATDYDQVNERRFSAPRPSAAVFVVGSQFDRRAR